MFSIEGPGRVNIIYAQQVPYTGQQIVDHKIRAISIVNVIGSHRFQAQAVSQLGQLVVEELVAWQQGILHLYVKIFPAQHIPVTAGALQSFLVVPL